MATMVAYPMTDDRADLPTPASAERCDLPMYIKLGRRYNPTSEPAAFAISFCQGGVANEAIDKIGELAEERDMPRAADAISRDLFHFSPRRLVGGKRPRLVAAADAAQRMPAPTRIMIADGSIQTTGNDIDDTERPPLIADIDANHDDSG
ncbi:unnamed protein product, partial [Prorocentrum cordatum]